MEAVPITEFLDAIEASMHIYEKGQFHMPARSHVDYEGNTLLLMPCFIRNYFGTKLVTLFARNAERGLPVLDGIMVLNDGQTGAPLAVLNGPALTGLRTAAISAVSIRHLVPEAIQSVGIIGAGVQGFYQAWVACVATHIMDVFVYDLHSEKTAALIERLSGRVPHVRLHQAVGAEQLLEQTQVVITATTSKEPVLPDKKELLANKHFVGIGSYKPDMREFPRALFGLVKVVYVDTDHALEESGDLIVPLRNNWIKKEQVMTLGRLLMQDKSKNDVRSATTLFKSVGMALFDVCAARLIYERAVEKGMGQEIAL